MNQLPSKSPAPDPAPSNVGSQPAVIGGADLLSTSRIVQAPDTPLSRIVDFASRLCSSILIKETRQAIKSRQFLWTYLALLVVCAIWAIAGLTFNIDRSETGPEMLLGYFFIMGFPLGIIVPFSAYRSLTREFEDGTIQLVSITTMRPWQIVAGKLGSALLQMLVYLSVLAPCIAFTYLLRGIGISQILIGTTICVSGSVCLTIVGLFLAGTTRSGALNVGMSVLFVVALAGIYFMWCGIISEFTTGSAFGNSSWGDQASVILFGFVALFGSTALLLFLSAAAQISFPSENRSTATRWVMLFQQVLFFAWFLAIFLVDSAYGNTMHYSDELPLVMGFSYGHYWLLMGFLMSGESFPLSQRVRRDLPTTLLGKSFRSLLMPGPGRGFLFCVANLVACTIVGCLIFLTLFSDNLMLRSFFPNNNQARFSYEVYEGCLTLVSTCVYVTSFLAVVYLLMTFRRRWPSVSVGQYNSLVGLLLGSILVILSCLVGYAVQINLLGHDEYTFMQLFNWHWTTAEMADRSLTEAFVAAAFFAIVATPLILFAIVLAARELLVEPTTTPERVIQDLTPPEPQLPPGESIDDIFAPQGAQGD